MVYSQPSFICSVDHAIAQKMYDQKISISLTLPEYNSLLFLSSNEDGRTVQLNRSFKDLSTSFLDNENAILAGRAAISSFSNYPQLAQSYPRKPNKYDCLFILNENKYHTFKNIQNISKHSKKIFFSDPDSSSVYKIDGSGFRQLWTSGNNNKCGLSSFSIENKKPEYITCYYDPEKNSHWTRSTLDKGVLINAKQDHILFKDLGLPNSVIAINNVLYFIQSLTGEVIKVDITNSTYDTVFKVRAFVNSMAIHDDLMFLTASRFNKDNSIFGDLPISERSFTGLIVIDIRTWEPIGKIEYNSLNTVISSINILEGVSRPNILTPEDKLMERVFITANELYWKEAEDHQIENNVRSSIQHNIIENVSSQDLLKKYSGLLYGSFAKKINLKGFEQKYHLLIAVKDRKAVAMLTFHIDEDNKFAEIVSVFVLKGHREKGIAAELFSKMEKFVITKNIKTIGMIYHSNMDSFEAIEKIADRNKWEYRNDSLINYKVKNDIDPDHPYYRKKYKLPEDYEIFSWGEIAKDDKEYILKKQESEEWFSPSLWPFIFENKVHSGASIGIKYQGNVIGWFVAYQFLENYLQVNCMFMDKEHRKSGMGLLFWLEATKRIARSGIPYITYQIEIPDKNNDDDSGTYKINQRNSVLRSLSANENLIESFTTFSRRKVLIK